MIKGKKNSVGKQRHLHGDVMGFHEPCECHQLCGEWCVLIHMNLTK